MSRRRPTNPTAAAYRPTNEPWPAPEFVGQQIPGGCDDCPAFWTVRKEPLAPGANVYRVTVYHELTCPTYLAVAR